MSKIKLSGYKVGFFVVSNKDNTFCICESARGYSGPSRMNVISASSPTDVHVVCFYDLVGLSTRSSDGQSEALWITEACLCRNCIKASNSSPPRHLWPIWVSLHLDNVILWNNDTGKPSTITNELLTIPDCQKLWSTRFGEIPTKRPHPMIVLISVLQQNSPSVNICVAHSKSIYKVKHS